MRRIILALVTSFTFMAMPLAAPAQVPGSVAGTIVAADGTPVANAAVTLRGSRGTYTAGSDASGHFAFRSIPSGSYDVAASAKGFSPLYGRTLDVSAGGATPIDLVLSPASASSLTVIGDVHVRGREAISTASAPSVTIGAQEYAARGYSQVAQMLAGELSTTVARPLGGGANLPSVVALRGPDPTETLVDVDGHEVNSGSTGDFDLSLLDPSDFQNVQVVYGIAPSSLIGPNTLGGAINIRTLEPTIAPHGLFRLSAGSNSTFGETMQATGTQGRLGYALSLGRRSSAGELSNFGITEADDGDRVTVGDALNASTGIAKVRYAFAGGGYAGIDVRTQSIFRDLSGNLTSVEDGGYNGSAGSASASHNAGYGLDLQLPLGASTTATLRHLTSLVSNSVTGPAADASPYLYNGRDLVGDDSLEIVRALPKGTLTLKMDLRTESLGTDFTSAGTIDQSIGRRPESAARIPMDDPADTPGVQRLTLGQTQRSAALAYAFEPTAKLHYTLAAYYSNFSSFGTSLDPRAGFVWTPDGRSALRFSVGSTFQSPQLTELYTPPDLPQPVDGYSNTGNPNLRPDRATEYDLGYEHVFGNAGHPLHLSLDLYRTNLRSPAQRYYSPTPCTDENDDPESCLSYPVNAGAAVYQGAELRGDYALAARTTLGFSYGIDSAFLTSIPADVQDGTLVPNEQILGVPLHKATLSLHHDPAAGLSYWGLLRYEGAYNELNRNAFATLDAGLTWHAGAFDLGLSGMNLTNVYADKFTQIGAGVPYGGVDGLIPTDAYALPARTITFTLTRRF